VPKKPLTLLAKVKALRADPAWKTIRQINKTLHTQQDFNLDPDVEAELQGYLCSSPLIPKYVSANNLQQVKRAQATLSEFDACLSRVVALQFDVAKAQQSLERLETIVRRILMGGGVLTDKITKMGATDTMAMVCPRLVDRLAAWQGLEKLCTLVHKRLSDSKDSLRLQIKLDDNARWAAKN
jgi:hypothetical protein